jgi:small-conductance mechanosensitive channel
MFWLNLFRGLRLDADERSGGGGEDPAEDDANSGGNGGERDDESDGGDDHKVVTMTEDALNKLFGERASRAERAGVKALLEKLGVQDEKSLAALVKAQQDAAQAEKTDLEKANERVEALEAQNRSLADQLRRQKLEAAVRETARDMKFRNPQIALSMVNLDDLDVDEDGKVLGVREALEALAKSDEYLVESEADKKPDLNAQTKTKVKPEETREDDLRRRFGI